MMTCSKTATLHRLLNKQASKKSGSQIDEKDEEYQQHNHQQHQHSRTPYHPDPTLIHYVQRPEGSTLSFPVGFRLIEAQKAK